MSIAFTAARQRNHREGRRPRRRRSEADLSATTAQAGAYGGRNIKPKSLYHLAVKHRAIFSLNLNQAVIAVGMTPVTVACDSG